jgi:AcrR family transcriptional regulator
MKALKASLLEDPRMDPRMKRTRAALSSALLSLLQEKPFDEISTRDIAERAKIGYATFFRNYESNREVLHELIADQIRQVIELAFPAIEGTNGRAAALALCTFVDEHRKLWTALLTGGAAGIVREEFIRQGAKVKTMSTPRAWLPLELANIYGVSGTVEILAWWLQRGRGVSVNEIARILDRLVISPFIKGRA